MNMYIAQTRGDRFEIIEVLGILEPQEATNPGLAGTGALNAVA